MYKKLTTSLVLLTFPCIGFAQINKTAGISGEIALLGGFSSSTSNLNTNNSDVWNPGKSPKNETQGIVFPFGNIAYTFDSLDKEVYLGTSRQDLAIGTELFELGYRQQFASGTTIDISYLPSIMEGEVWKDPYAKGIKRDETDEKGNAVRLQLKSIQGSPVSIELAYGTKDVDDEMSGQDAVDNNGMTSQQQKLLRRDGDSFYAKTSYRQFLSRTWMVIPSVNYLKHDADGDAMSFDRWKAEISNFNFIGRHSLALTLGYSHSNYDASNPLFNKTRKDDSLSAFAAYKYKHFMNLKDWMFVSMIGYSNTNANIKFYDESQYMMTAGMNYQF